MIEETAVVTQTGRGQVWIKSLHSDACGGCQQRASCGTATLGKLLPKREFAVECDLPLQVGEQVRVAIDDSHLLLSSLVLYLLPLLMMLGGVGLAAVWLPAAIVDSWMPEIALTILLLAFWLIHRCQAPLLLYFCCKPRISGRLGASDQV